MATDGQGCGFEPIYLEFADASSRASVYVWRRDDGVTVNASVSGEGGDAVMTVTEVRRLIAALSAAASSAESS